MEQQLSAYLFNTLSSDVKVRREAEQFIEICENQPGFGQQLLKLVADPQADFVIKLCAAIAFKNYVKKYWSYSDDPSMNKINVQDRDYCKNVIVSLMLNSDEKIQKQLSEAISLIGQADFPEKWPNLLENMIIRLNESCQQYNFNVIFGLLQTAESLFKRYQFESKSEKLWQEIKFVLDTFAKTFTELFVWIVKLIPEQINNVQNIKIIFKSLVYCAEIFYSLNSQDLAEFFEDNMNVWMSNFVQILQINTKTTGTSDEEPGDLENLKSQICENINMFAEKYSEEFDVYIPGFINQIFTMLYSLNDQVKYDLFVCNAIKFLCTVAGRGLYKQLFEKEEVLERMCSQIIIPNMEFRELEERFFQWDPEEYIRRDIEGADIQTRRRAACDLVKALAKHFEVPMTQVFSKYIETMLSIYSQNPQKHWKNKNSAIYLVTSLVVKGGSVRLGTTSTSDLINITNFFNNVIRSDLEGNQINQDIPVAQADALKYVIIFRNQLSVNEVILPILPLIIRHLSSSSVVVHSYAAMCIEKILTLREPNTSQPMIKPANIEQYSLSLIEGLFGVLQKEDSEENEYAIKAIMRVFSLLRERLLPYFNVLLPKLTEKFTKVAKNPLNPNFNHYLFETLSLSIRIGCNNNPAALNSFESVLFPIFHGILVQDVQEFSPYVFQILALLLELHPPEQIPESFMELFPFLLVPVLWERPANFAPLVCLIQAYVKTSSKNIVKTGKLEPLLGVFQKLVASKTNDHLAFKIINHLIMFADPQALQPLMKQIFIILFQRLTNAKTTKYIRSLLLFFGLFIYKFGAVAFYQIIESLQKQMFRMVLEKLFIADAQKTTGMLDRKYVCVGAIKLLTELDQFFTMPELTGLWAPLLQVVIAVFESPQDKTETQDAENHFVELDVTTGYQASYSRLVFAANPDQDLMADIVDPRLFLAQKLKQLTDRYPGKISPLIASMQPDAVKFLQNYLRIANVNIS